MAIWQFGHAPHIDGDGVALLDAHRLEHIGEAVDLFPELEVAVGALLAVLAFPQQRQLVLAPALDVAIQRVVDDVGLAAGKPLEEGRLAAVERSWCTVRTSRLSLLRAHPRMQPGLRWPGDAIPDSQAHWPQRRSSADGW
jgi:hypothetical protein